MIAVVVGCDWCLVEARSYGAENFAHARDILTDDGWDFTDGLELCPTCKALPRPQILETAGAF